MQDLDASYNSRIVCGLSFQPLAVSVPLRKIMTDKEDCIFL